MLCSGGYTFIGELGLVTKILGRLCCVRGSDLYWGAGLIIKGLSRLCGV